MDLSSVNRLCLQSSELWVSRCGEAYCTLAPIEACLVTSITRNQYNRLPHYCFIMYQLFEIRKLPTETDVNRFEY